MFSYFESVVNDKQINNKRGGKMPVKKECSCGCKTKKVAAKKVAVKKVAAKKVVKKTTKK